MHVSTEETKVKDAEVAEEFKHYFPHIRFENVSDQLPGYYPANS